MYMYNYKNHLPSYITIKSQRNYAFNPLGAEHFFMYKQCDVNLVRVEVHTISDTLHHRVLCAHCVDPSDN